MPGDAWSGLDRGGFSQELSGGRFLLGVGTSGPRVMEGWHGVRFRKPVQTTRETIEIVRIISHGDRLEHHGNPTTKSHQLSN